MEVGPLVVLGLMWVVLNALRKGGRRPSGGSGTPPASGRSGLRLPDSTRQTDVPNRLPRGGSPLDATQREGSQLERLLRDLGRTLDQAAQQGKQPTSRPRPPSRTPTPGRPTKQGGSLVSPGGPSRELDPAGNEPGVLDLDDEAERVVKQRIAAAEANLRPLSEADRRAFEQRIREEPPAQEQPVARAYTPKQLRDGVVWREILGPPVSLRGEEDGAR